MQIEVSDAERLRLLQRIESVRKLSPAADCALQMIQELVSRRTADSEEYIHACREAVGVLAETRDQSVLQLILDFSRLHCDVADIYDSFDLRLVLAPLIAENPSDCTGCNDTFFHDTALQWYCITCSEREQQRLPVDDSWFDNQPFFSGPNGDIRRKTVLSMMHKARLNRALADRGPHQLNGRH